MKAFLKKHLKRIIILSCDVLIIPVLFFCRWLSGTMLQTDNPCMWTLVGIKCATCGGTHFVNDLLNGRIVDAFWDNHLMFITLVFFGIAYIFLNLYLLFDLKFAHIAVFFMCNPATIVYFFFLTILFTIARNVPYFIYAAQVIISAIT